MSLIRSLVMALAFGALSTVSVSAQGIVIEEDKPGAKPVVNFSHVSPGGLSLKQSKQLMLIVLRHSVKNPSERRFLYIEEDLREKSGQRPYSGYIDYFIHNVIDHKIYTLATFDINPMTGDVWDFMICKHYRFPALAGIQRKIRTQTHKTAADDKAALERLHVCPYS